MHLIQSEDDEMEWNAVFTNSYFFMTLTLWVLIYIHTFIYIHFNHMRVIRKGLRVINGVCDILLAKL